MYNEKMMLPAMAYKKRLPMPNMAIMKPQTMSMRSAAPRPIPKKLKSIFDCVRGGHGEVLV
jgi:hypothetical protein